MYYRVLFSELIEAMKGIPPVKQSDLIDVSHLYTILLSTQNTLHSNMHRRAKSTSWIHKFLARLESQKIAIILLKICNQLFFKSTSTNKTNNGILDNTHRSLFYGVYDVKNNYVCKKKLTNHVSLVVFNKMIFNWQVPVDFT